MVRVGEAKELRALPRDRSRRRVEHDVTFQWQIVEGPGALAGMHNQAVTFLAPDEPGLTRVKVTVRQRDVVCAGESSSSVLCRPRSSRIGDRGRAVIRPCRVRNRLG